MARTKTTELMDLIFDKLANNTSYKQFEPEMAEEMELVYNMNTGQAEYISMTITVFVQLLPTEWVVTRVVRQRVSWL